MIINNMTSVVAANEFMYSITCMIYGLDEIRRYVHSIRIQ